MKNSDEKKEYMCLLIPRHIKDALDTQAKNEGEASRAVIIRRACMDYLKKNGVELGLGGVKI